ncbi:MAG: wax ester/triacylglycerol synthase family O-acyltransferase [Acidimicrobiales bacterium]|nr:wax ester/triacylglycerol synthase family O-acyltransferase [Acidimicrobiales bacterium]
MNVRQIAGPDAAFLYGERPEWPFHVSALMLIDPTGTDRFSFDAVVDLLERRLHKVPQFRWKLVEGPLHMRLDRPIWVDDPEFDVHHHITKIAVPGPGDDRALGELVGRLVSIKLDRTRPLWEMWFIEGLADGRCGLLAKIHHSIIDGQSGMELATLLYDSEADPEPDPEPPPYEPEPQPAMAERLVVGAANATLWPLRASRLTRQIVRQGATMGRHLLGSSVAAQPFQAPRTPLNGRLTSERSFADAEVSLAEVKRVKDAFGVKVNDGVLALSASALRSYLLEHDALPSTPLVAQVPVSLRNNGGDARAVGTQVAAMFCSLATNVGRADNRLKVIHRSTDSGKEMRRQLTDAHEESLTDALPPALLAIAARAWSLAGLDDRSPPVFNLIISNVAGPPFDLYMAGARIDAMYPMGPLLAGSGLNITVVSTADSLDFGLQACPALVPDVWDIADRIGPALDELSEAADAVESA